MAQEPTRSSTLTPTTGKQRAARIELDYLKRPHPLDRPKKLLALLAGGIAAVWCASGFVPGIGDGDLRYSRGPVAAPHATWDAECSACHSSFKPIGEGKWAEPLAQSLLGADLKWKSDLHCSNCHVGAVHHASESYTPNCAECHRDHQGRDARLTRVGDHACTQCHSQLDQYTAHDKKDSLHCDCPWHKPASADAKSAETKRFENKVTSFNTDHPEFRYLSKSEHMDPSDIKFSHRVHMTTGFPLDLFLDETKKNPWYKISDIPTEAGRRRYRRDGQKDGDMVQMACNQCHTLDSGDVNLAGLQGDTGKMLDPATRRAIRLHVTDNSGGYMLPVRYETHCEDCHTLTMPDKREKTGFRELPHGIEPEEMRRLLRERLAYGFIAPEKEDEVKPKQFAPTREEITDLREKIERDLATLERFVINAADGKEGCAKCHNFQEPMEPFKNVKASVVPEVWYPHATFDHTAHRAVNCYDCHINAYPTTPDGKPNEKIAKDSDQIILPSIKTCQECHAPASGHGESRKGGARFDCVECHRYHNGDRPLQGIGAKNRAVNQTATIGTFRSGRFPAGAATPKADSAKPAAASRDTKPTAEPGNTKPAESAPQKK